MGTRDSSQLILRKGRYFQPVVSFTSSCEIKGLFLFSFIVIRVLACMFLCPVVVACSFPLWLYASFGYEVLLYIVCRLYLVVRAPVTVPAIFLLPPGPLAIVCYNLLEGVFLFRVLFSVA